MMKKLVTMILVLGMLCFLTGCGMVLDFTLTADGKTTVNSAGVYYTAEEVKMLEEMGSGDSIPELKEVTYRGKVYYVQEDSDDLEEFEELESSDDIVMNENGAYLLIGDSSSGGDSVSQSDLAGLEFYDVVVRFPKTVVEANGDIGADGTSVTYDMKNNSDGVLWAVFSENALNVTGAKISGVKDGGKYNKAVTLKLETEGIFTSAQLTLKSENGTGTTAATTVVEADVDGDYTYIYTVGKERNTIKFTVDRTKPKANVQSGKTYKAGKKITFSDNWSGIKSAKLDGKTIKSGKKVTAKGSHTLKLVDKCGNSKTVKFKIK